MHVKIHIRMGIILSDYGYSGKVLDSPHPIYLAHGMLSYSPCPGAATPGCPPAGTGCIAMIIKYSLKDEK